MKMSSGGRRRRRRSPAKKLEASGESEELTDRPQIRHEEGSQEEITTTSTSTSTSTTAINIATIPTIMSFDPMEADKNDPLSWTRDEFELPLRAESGGQGEHWRRESDRDSAPDSIPTVIEFDCELQAKGT